MASSHRFGILAAIVFSLAASGEAEERNVPFHMRSKQFQGGDEITIESLVKLEAAQDARPRYEVKGRYRLQSADGAELAPWCSNGKLEGNKGIEIRKGEGTFRLAFTLVERGNLHLSLYPLVAGARSSFGSLYYDIGSASEEAKGVTPSQPGDRAAASPARPSENEWQTDRSELFRLHYPLEVARDAKHVKVCLEKTFENLGTEFGAERVKSLLGAAVIDVYVHPRATETAREGLLTLKTGLRAGRLAAEIHLLALSAHGAATTAVGEPMDENYLFKNLVHEYSTILLEQMTLAKPTGWNLYSAPSWFVQGYEEYLGLTLSSEHSRNVTFQKYRDLHRQDRNRVTREFGVKNPYLDGPVLMEFLHESYGKEKVQALLTSDKAEFWSAVSATLGVDREQLYEAWSKWVRKL